MTEIITPLSVAYTQGWHAAEKDLKERGHTFVRQTVKLYGKVSLWDDRVRGYLAYWNQHKNK